MAPQAPGRIISVGGGKGGVGKSVVAANLAVAMAQEGSQVVIVDADLGAANQHTLFGIDRPGPTLQGVIDHSLKHLEEARIDTGVPNVSLIPGSGAVLGAANINHGQKTKLLRQIGSLDADVVIVDVGAGVAFNSLDFFDVADTRLLVANPQLLSIQNAYSFLKGAVYRSLQKAATAAGSDFFDSAPPSSETERVSSLVKRAGMQSPALANTFEETLSSFNAHLLGNQVFDAKEGDVLRSVSRMVHDFLRISVPVLGYMRASRIVHESVNRRRPFLLDATNEESAASLRRTARTLLAQDVASLRAPRGNAVKTAPATPAATPSAPPVLRVVAA